MAARPYPTAPGDSLLTPSFAKLSLGFFFCCMILGLFALVPYYLELRGTSETFYGSAAGMHGLGGLLGMLVFGGSADHHTRRASSLRYFAPTVLAALLALPAMHWHPAWYWLCLGLQGVTGGVGLPMLFVWASELSPPARRTEAFAWLGIAGLAADSLGPLLGELLLSSQGPVRQPEDFQLVFLAALLLAPLVIACLVAAPDVAPVRDDSAAARRLWPLLAQPAVPPTLLAAVPFGGALGVLLSLGKNFVASLELQFVSVLLVGYTVGAVSSRLLLPWILRIVSRRRLPTAGFCGIVVSMLLLARTDGYGTLLLAGLTYGVSHGVLFPTLLSRLIDFGGAAAAGRLGTLYMGMFSLGTGIFTAGAGLMLRSAGYPLVFISIALGCAGGVALTLRAEAIHARTTARQRTSVGTAGLT